jgi:hypothetical protein
VKKPVGLSHSSKGFDPTEIGTFFFSHSNFTLVPNFYFKSINPEIFVKHKAHRVRNNSIPYSGVYEHFTKSGSLLSSDTRMIPVSLQPTNLTQPGSPGMKTTNPKKKPLLQAQSSSTRFSQGS